MSTWILSHSRGFVQLCHVDEFNYRQENMPDWIHASVQRALWNRKHVRDDRTDILWSTVHWKELYIPGSGDTWYNTSHWNRIGTEHDMCIPRG